MPVIPLIESERSVEVGGIDVYANPDQFGAGIGRELRQAGQALIGIGREAKAKADANATRERNARLATRVADSSIAFAKTSAGIQTTAPADGKGTMDATLIKQRQIIEETAKGIEDPIERTAYTTEMTQR